jgi:transposase
MTRPYSMDLRERAVARVLAGESVRSVASMLSVSAASVVRWAGRYRATGSAAPGKIGGHKVGILSGAHRDWLLERVTRDFTLRGLVAELGERGVKVDYVQVWRFVHAEGLSFKKKRSARRATPAQDRQTARAVEEIPEPA